MGGKDNVLNGGAGRDTLIGGEGDDEFTGGQGLDTYVVAPGGGVDRVMDFEIGRDKIDLTAYSSSGIDGFDDLAIEQVGGDSVIAFDEGNAIIVIDTNGLRESDFLLA
jgi:glycerophosphoryl diester phosphodiesterase